MRWTGGARAPGLLLIGMLGGGLASAPSVWAQPVDYRGSFELSGGIIGLGGYSLESADATLTPNRASAGPFRLFSTTTDVDGAPGVEARLGTHLNRVMAIEAGLTFARLRVSTRISDDAEQAADTSAEERLAQYVIDVNVVLHLTGVTFDRGQGVPFVTAGGGYLRQLHEGETLVETGWVSKVGGGVKYLFVRRPKARMRAIGLRTEFRMYFKRRGFDLADRTRTFIAGSAGLLVIF